MNKEVTPVLKSWQFFLSCKHVLGDVFITSLYNRGARQIYRWSANPDFTSQEGHERNPLDRMQILLERLHERGRTDVALSALALMANAIGYEVIPSTPAIPDKASIEEEMLDDYPSLVKLHNSIRNHSSTESIRHFANQAKRDIDETAQKYINDKQQ
jgi:hypothetical protein